jgi:signal transduction histidine kinase
MRDVAAVLIGLALAVGTALQRFERHSAEAIIEGVLCGVAALALFRRRSSPVTVVLVAIAVTTITGVEYAMLIAVATLTIRRRDRVSAALVVAGIASMVAGPRITLLHDRVGHDNVVGSVINATLAVGLLAALGAYVGVRRDLVRSLQERAERAEAEREIREERGRLNERTRIAREMHDVLAHKVSLIALQAGGLEVTNDLSPDVVRSSAALIRQTAHQALEDLREVLGVLRDEQGEALSRYAPQPSLADVPALIDDSRRAGLPVTMLSSVDVAAPIADLVGRAAYRLVQEALTNVLKHARSAATTVRLDGAPGSELRIEVVNLAPVAAGQLLPGSGLGLVGLRERVALANGQFDAGRTRDGGFRVHAVLPWPAEPSLGEAAASAAANPSVPEARLLSEAPSPAEARPVGEGRSGEARPLGEARPPAEARSPGEARSAARSPAEEARR